MFALFFVILIIFYLAIAYVVKTKENIAEDRIEIVILIFLSLTTGSLFYLDSIHTNTISN